MNRNTLYNHRIGAILLLMTLALAMPATAEPQDEDAAVGYRIGPKDLLEIKVFEVPDLNIELRVEENGAIRLPLLGDVDVEGMTPNQVADRVRTKLEARYVQQASVTVEVREYRSRPISVIGAVRQPGPLALSGRWTLLEAIAAAGGLTDDHGNMIYVLRRAESGLTDQLPIDLNQLPVYADPDLHPPDYAGDRSNVPATGGATGFGRG